MQYQEMTLEDVNNNSLKLYNIIKKDFDYDLVIFIAKGSFLIGKELSRLNNTELLEISAKRKGNKFKSILKLFKKIIPKKILIKLRKKEMESNYHLKKNERKIEYDKDLYMKNINKKKILLVDDSIDTGNSIKLSKEELVKVFKNSTIKIAVFNVMDKAIIKPDYYLYKNTMICGPWSNDSKYYSTHIKEYNLWKTNK